MARDVIMPALGMAQETGLIVAWLKKPGEAVRAGEPLFEVETDKAVMAVEAEADGVLEELRHGEGAEVPVGEVIARIGRTGAGAEVAQGSAAPPAEEGRVAARAPDREPEATVPPPAATSEPAVVPRRNGAAVAEAGTARTGSAGPNGRVLASPKARRLARERGIDLHALVRAGLPQPFHAADLDRLSAFRPGPPAGANRIAARAEAGALLAFRRLLAEEGVALSDAALWAAFAAGSLREASGRGAAPLVVAVERPGVPAARFGDPDLGPLADVQETAGEAARDLVLRDLTGLRLTEVALARDAGPSLSIGGGEGGYALSLAFPEGSLPEEEALAFLEALAARIEQPLRHLL